jgi:hypothetical protein
MRRDLLEQILSPKVGLADVEQAVRKVLRHDPMKMEDAIGHLYGRAFKKAEEAYAARGSRGKQRWP